MKTCEMCGKKTEFVTNRMYQYDNGEQFNAAVCGACAELHARLVKA
jgi:hypothetical protein